MTNEDMIKIIKRLLSDSSDKELGKRKLGRGKKGIALEEIRYGLEQIVALSEDCSGGVKEHQFNKDTVSRLANKSWASDELKKQQTSLKRTSTEISNSITILDRLIASINDQRFDAMEQGKEVDYSATMGLQARRKDLLNAKTIVLELKDTIEWAKDIKKRDEIAEANRKAKIGKILKAEVTKIVFSYTALDLVARISSHPNMYESPADSLKHLQEYGSKQHIASLKNQRQNLINQLMAAHSVTYDFMIPANNSWKEPLPLTSENIKLKVDNEYSYYDQIKKRKDYLDYVEHFKSAKSVQSAIQTDDSEFVFCEDDFRK